MPHDPLLIVKAVGVLTTVSAFLIAAAILGALAPGDDYPSDSRITGWVGQ